MAERSSADDWARRLVGVEMANRFVPEGGPSATVRICEKLRSGLTRVIGPDGFAALLRRALAMARKDVASLAAVTVTTDGHVLEMALLDDDELAALALTRHVLDLLVVLIGESLTLRLLREVFPTHVPMTFEPEDL